MAKHVNITLELQRFFITELFYSFVMCFEKIDINYDDSCVF